MSVEEPPTISALSLAMKLLYFLQVKFVFTFHLKAPLFIILASIPNSYPGFP
jgi:hypothetical protein